MRHEAPRALQLRDSSESPPCDGSSGAGPGAPKGEVSRAARPRKRGRNEKAGRGRVRSFRPWQAVCMPPSRPRGRELGCAARVGQGVFRQCRRGLAGLRAARAAAAGGRSLLAQPFSAARPCTGPRPSPRAGSPARTAPRSPPSCSPAAARSRRSGTRSSWP